MLNKIKYLLSQNFEIKNLGENSYIIDMEIYRNRSKG